MAQLDAAPPRPPVSRAVEPARLQPAAPEQRPRASLLHRILHSLSLKLAILAVAFIVLPVVIYREFRSADLEKQAILISAVRDRGLTIAEALRPHLARTDAVPFAQLPEELARFAGERVRIKLLFRPSAAADAGFFYVASVPPVDGDGLKAERQRLAELGVLDRLSASCAGDVPLAERLRLPDGSEELLTSITPIRSDSGCWGVVLSDTARALGSVVGGGPYWQRHEVRIAFATYTGLAALVFFVFFSIWRSLARFGRLARGIGDARAASSFRELTAIPELQPVAASFDRMVGKLRASAELIRRAAEDNAHAFKTPLGVIRQAIEPLRRRVPQEDERGRAALDAVAASVAKLDGLVQSARRLDEATADLLDPATYEVGLSELLQRINRGYAEMLGAEAHRFRLDSVDGVRVLARDDLIETMLENVIDNALSFSPPEGVVELRLTVQGQTAAVSVADRGPGVPEDRIERIFDRYYSDRPFQPAMPDDDHGPFGQTGHFGIGLWLVRQHARGLKGDVHAANRPGGGLVITITLPRLA